MAAAQDDRDSRCYNEMVAVAEQAKKEGGDLLTAINASRSLRIPCCQTDLDAVDALMEKLTPEGPVALRASVDRFRATLKTSVPKGDLADCRKPR